MFGNPLLAASMITTLLFAMELVGNLVNDFSTMFENPFLVPSMITMLIFAMELVGKLVNDISIESIGADLCMLSFSFNVSTLFIGQITSNEITDNRFITVITFMVLFVILIAWLISLKLINGRQKPENLGTWFRKYRVDFFVTMLFGLSALLSQMFLISQLTTAS